MLILAEAADRWGQSPLRVIEGNHISGFPLAVWLRSLAGDHPSRFVVRDNFLDGSIRVEGPEATRRLLSADNSQSDTLAPVQAEILDRLVQPIPAPVPASGRKQAEGPSEEQRDEASYNVR